MVDKIARAVLYEGYLLYPYRQSALKNQRRWNFGVLYPPAWAAKQTGSDRSFFQMECLAACGLTATFEVSVRFLQFVACDTGDRHWQEAAEQIASIDPLKLTNLLGIPYRQQFALPGDVEAHLEATRRKFPIAWGIEISASRGPRTCFSVDGTRHESERCIG